MREPEPLDQVLAPGLLRARNDLNNLLQARYGKKYSVKYPILEKDKATSVYRVYDNEVGSNLAFKCVSSRMAKKEADTLRILDNELIVKYEETISNISTECSYIVLRWFDSEPLDQHLTNREGKDISDAYYMDLADLMLRALSVAHENDIVHRDIKPDNYLVSKKGIVSKKRGLKLNDLGLSRLILHPSSRSAGATGFRAPEALRYSEPIIESDIYSMGVLLYELFVGDISTPVHFKLSEKLFKAWEKDEQQNLKQLTAEAHSDVLTQSYSSAKLLNDDADGKIETKRGRLDEVIRHCLEYNHEQRYHSAEGVRIDLWLALNPELIDSKKAGNLGLEAAFGMPRSPEKLDAICNAYRNILLHCDTSQGDLSHSWLLKSYNGQFANYLDNVIKELSAQCIKKGCKTVLGDIRGRYSDTASLTALQTPRLDEKYLKNWRKAINPQNNPLIKFFSNYKVV